MKKKTSQTQESATSSNPAYSNVLDPVKEPAEIFNEALYDTEELSDDALRVVVGGRNQGFVRVNW